MSIGVYVANSHRWLHEKLVESSKLDGLARLVDTPDDGELIVYLDPPWPDAGAPDRLRRFGPRDFTKLYVYSQADEPLSWAPGMYASLAARRARRGQTGGFYVPHHHREPGGICELLEAARANEPDLLWSFVGTASNHPVRRVLLELPTERALLRDTQRFSDDVRWQWQSSLRAEGRAAFGDFATSIGRSLFVACPRGRGPSSIRIFEALQVGRCPVIISDDWLPPPFPDWEACSIRVRESEAGKLPALLRARESEAPELGRNARVVWERFFSPERQLATLVRACLELRADLPARLNAARGVLTEPSVARLAWRAMKRHRRFHRTSRPRNHNHVDSRIS